MENEEKTTYARNRDASGCDLLASVSIPKQTKHESNRESHRVATEDEKLREMPWCRGKQVIKVRM